MQMKGERRKARGLALQALYEIDCADHKVSDVLEGLLEGVTLSPENRAFCTNLVTGVLSHIEDIDNKISFFAPAWPVSQMAMVDRAILRIAIFELQVEKTHPVGVVINEAVELAKAFGGEGTPRFINGVLSSVSQTVSGV